WLRQRRCFRHLLLQAENAHLRANEEDDVRAVTLRFSQKAALKRGRLFYYKLLAFAVFSFILKMSPQRNRMKGLLLAAGIIIAPAIAFSQGSYLDIMGIIRGDSLGAQFGKKVVPAGDVNGDTIPDFLVLGTGSQKVYLFHGKKGGLDTLPDLVFEHKSQLEVLGDINVDTGPDFAMRESGQQYRLSIYFGGACLDTIPDGQVKGNPSGIAFDSYGLHVSAGKLSATRDAQIVVGKVAQGFDTTRFYFYNGIQDAVDSIAFLEMLVENKQGVQAGPSQVLQDVNGDGYADLAIGRTGQTSAAPGSVEIYYGGTTFDTIPDIILHPPPFINSVATPAFGEKIGSVGDLNNDGFSDFVVGVSRLPMLYLGGNPLDTLPLFVLDRIGDHFVNGGDINADGYTDLLVGRDDFPITGSAYVYYGGSTMDSIVDLEIRELDLPTPARGFGQTVAGLGDIDGNGSNDFAVGSTSNTDPDRGYLWVFNGFLPSTDVEDEESILPRDFTLSQNYPNPFNSNTVISYSLSRRSLVRLEIFNILGNVVKVLVEAEQPASSHQVQWDGTDSIGNELPSGIYIYRLKAGNQSETKKTILIR
ncbi:MAG: FG-GAP-like repeat-containing protein, partial [candidate division Zixibacteria bacterium]|nr:FG-GAP-like repeat-containing protein [candidate division Zixibacteria bacterium]